MIIQWILSICLMVLSFYVRYYFFLRASNYYNDESLNLKRIYAIIYYILALSYFFYMFLVVLSNFDEIQRNFLLTFLSWILLINIIFNVLFLTCLIQKC